MRLRCAICFHTRWKYNGKMLTIKGKLDQTEEGTWLTDRDCPKPMLTEDHVWPSVIVLESNNWPSQFLISFEFDGKSAAKTGKTFARLKQRVSPSCMLWTYTGLFETRTDWSNFKDSRFASTDGVRFFGFGHMGWAPGQLRTKSVDDVEAIPDCTPE